MSSLFTPPPGAPNICSQCGIVQRKGKEHVSLVECLNAQRRAAELLVDKIGTPKPCAKCQATIYMIPVRDTTPGKQSGTQTVLKPYDLNGQSHMLSCPNASEFYRRK